MADVEAIYPKNKRVGFDGGQNNKFERHIIQDNESPECLNVVFDDGAVETRGGTSELTSVAAAGSFVGDGLYTRHSNDGEQSMCAWWNGTLHVWDGSTFVTQASSESVFTAGVRVGAAEYENYIFFGNGGTAPYKYNGDFTRHGVPAPTTTMTVASGDSAFSGLSGDYQYRVTWVNSNLVEGDVGPLTSTFVVCGSAARLTSVPTAPLSYGINQRRIYRTEDGGSTFKRLDTITNNTATTYVDSAISDASLGVTAPTDQGEPPNYSWIVTHANRLFCDDPANPSYVWYSEIGEPYTFKATNFIEIGDNSGDTVKAGHIHDNSLLVLGERGAYLVYMPDTTPSNWETIRTNSSMGSRSPFGLFTYNNKVMFPAFQNDNFVGFAAIQGNAVDPDATLLTVSASGSERKSDRIEPDMFDVVNAQADRISATVWRNKAYITLTKGSGNTTNNRVYVFDFSISNLSKQQEASWVPWSGFNAEQFTVYDGKLYYIDANATGLVYEMNTTTANDNGSAINSYYWTKSFTGVGGDEKTTKDFRFVELLYKNQGDYDMDVGYRLDTDKGDGTVKRVNLDTGGSNWGTLVWGVDNWDPGVDESDERIYLGQSRGQRVQFKFSNQNTANQKFKIVGLQFGYNRRGSR